MALSVAFLGLGLMGRGMADRLLEKQFAVTVWNRTLEKAALLAERGAHVASTPADAARGADVIVAMLGDDASSREVWLGAHGALATAHAGAIAIECSTLSPDWTRELAGIAAEKGVRFIEAPVAGSKDAAAAGTLRLFVAGESAVIEEVRPVLEAFSGQINLMGPVGAGATWKLINNLLNAIQAAGLAEALALAQAAGLDMKQVSDLIHNGAAASGLVRSKLPVMLAGNFEDTSFALKWMEKDARYAVALSEAHGLAMPVLRAAWAEFAGAAADEARAESDFSAIYEYVSGEGGRADA